MEAFIDLFSDGVGQLNLFEIASLITSGKHVRETNTPVHPTFIFTIFALSAGFQLSKINIENTGNQNHPDLKVRVVLVTCIFDIDFYTSPLKKCGVLCYTLKKKFAFECPSVRLSVYPSVRLSVRQRFVSGLYLEQLLTDFLQTLYRSSYQEGVVWD